MAGAVIIGAGQAGLQAAIELRAAGYDRPVTLIGEEDALPYHRPPLSKAYLTGEKSADALLMRGEAFYAEQAITLALGTIVVDLDRQRRVVTTADGRVFPYDHAVLATGAAARPLSCAGRGLDGVQVLRSRFDAEALRARLAGASALVVIGGGFIGLEVAASARKLGLAVTVLEMQDRLMARAVGPGISAFFAQAHRARGVDLRLGEGPPEIVGEGGRVTAVRLASGMLVPCQVVVGGVGVTPNVTLAEAAGLAVSNGIVVDARQRTSDEAVFALGDCASFPHPSGEGRLRLESVQNAVDQARIVASAIMGRSDTYAAVPWFWSDQYDLKLQMVGLSHGHTHVVERGDRETGRFSAFYFRDGRLIAIDSVNRPADHMRGRRLLASAAPVTEADLDLHFPAQARH